MSVDLAIVLAGGGERAVAWELGVLAGLADAGLDLGGVELTIGTSAGALVGAHLAAGADLSEAVRAICVWPSHPAAGSRPLGEEAAPHAGTSPVGAASVDAQRAGASLEGAPHADGSPVGAASVDAQRAGASLEGAPHADGSPVGAASVDAQRAGASSEGAPHADASLAALNDDDPPGPAFAQALATWVAAADAGVEEQRRRVGAVALDGPQGDERLVAATAWRLPPRGWSESLTLVAIDAERGERVALRRSDDVPLERAVAASRAIPGLRPVVSAAGRRLMDGAVGSATNADLAAGAQRIAIVTPTPGDAPPESLFALWNAALERERALLEQDGAELLVVQAGPADQEAMGPDMLSGARAPEAFEAGRRSGAEALLSCRRPDRWRTPASA